MIFSAYRRDDFADPDGFVLQLGLVLERYPNEIISEVASPLTGIQRRYKTPPSLAALVEECDYHSERAQRLAEYAALPKPTRRGPMPVAQGRGAFANLFVLAGRPGYDAMVAWSTTADPREFKFADGGIHVPLGVYLENRHKGAGAGVGSARGLTVADMQAMDKAEAAAAE